jgi:hypothetical protein
MWNKRNKQKIYNSLQILLYNSENIITSAKWDYLLAEYIWITSLWTSRSTTSIGGKSIEGLTNMALREVSEVPCGNLKTKNVQGRCASSLMMMIIIIIINDLRMEMRRMWNVRTSDASINRGNWNHIKVTNNIPNDIRALLMWKHYHGKYHCMYHIL